MAGSDAMQQAVQRDTVGSAMWHRGQCSVTKQVQRCNKADSMMQYKDWNATAQGTLCVSRHFPWLSFLFPCFKDHHRPLDSASCTQCPNACMYTCQHMHICTHALATHMQMSCMPQCATPHTKTQVPILTHAFTHTMSTGGGFMGGGDVTHG